MTIRLVDDEIAIRRNFRAPGYTVYGVDSNPLAGTDTEAEALAAKRAFELVLAPRFTRDEAIAIVGAAMREELERVTRTTTTKAFKAGLRAALEALAAAGVFVDNYALRCDVCERKETEPFAPGDGCPLCRKPMREITMADRLDAAIAKENGT